MSDVDPLDVGFVLAVPAFFGSIASFVYEPAILLALPLAIGIVLLLVGGFFVALGNVWGDLRD